MSNIRLQEKNPSNWNIFDIFVLISFSYNSVMVYFSAVFARLPIINVVGYQILPLFVACLAIICFARGYFRLYVKDVLFVLCFALFILMSYILRPETQAHYTQAGMKDIYVQAIPFFLLGLSFRSDSGIVKKLTYISYIAIIINFVYMFFYVGLTSEDGEYYMGQAYVLLPHVMLSINSIFDRAVIKSRIVAILFSMFGIFFLVAMGTRGPLLVSLVYLVVKVFLLLNRKNFKTVLPIGVLLVVLFLLVSSGAHLLLLRKLSDLISSYGMSTRVIDMFVSNEYLSHMSGRDRIYELLIGKIFENPILGYGIFGEKQFGVLAHNIVLEIVVYYGIPLGVTIIVAYAIITLKAYFRCENKYAKDLILLFLVMTVARAPFGGSHLSYYFFFLLGLSLSELRKNKYHSIESVSGR